jgi:hypothetical protein
LKIENWNLFHTQKWLVIVSKRASAHSSYIEAPNTCWVLRHTRWRENPIQFAILYSSNSLSLINRTIITTVFYSSTCSKHALENLAEFYIFNWCTAPGGDEDIWAIKLFWSDGDSKMRKALPILMMNQGCFTFCQKFLRKKNIRLNDHVLKWGFGQMNFRSYVISVFWLVFQVRFSVKWQFFKYFRKNSLLINFVFGQMTFFGKMNFRSNGLRLNGDSVKCTFGQMAYGQTVFGQMVFQSNGIRSNGVRSNGFSVKWPFGQNISVKLFFGKVIQKLLHAKITYWCPANRAKIKLKSQFTDNSYPIFAIRTDLMIYSLTHLQICVCSMKSFREWSYNQEEKSKEKYFSL